MTLDKMLRIVRVLSNSCFVRWWAHWNYPQQSPHKIAFCAINEDGKNEAIYEGDFAKYNYNKAEIDGKIYFVFDRLNEDGTLYEGRL